MKQKNVFFSRILKNFLHVTKKPIEFKFKPRQALVTVNRW